MVGFEIVLFYWLGALIILLSQVIFICALTFGVGVLIYASWERWLKKTPRAIRAFYKIMLNDFGLKKINKNFKYGKKIYKLVEVDQYGKIINNNP